MGVKIQIRRGKQADLPTLDTAEIGFTTDTERLYIGNPSGSGNILMSIGPGGFDLGNGADGYVSFFTGPNRIAGDNDFFWDRENNRLGIRTSEPTHALTVDGYIAPELDNVSRLGTPTQRWEGIHLGPNSLHISSTSTETGTAFDWRMGIDQTTGNEGKLIIAQGESIYFTIDPVTADVEFLTDQLIVNGALKMAELPTPPLDESGFGKLYVDAGDKAIHFLDSTGVDFNLLISGGTGNVDFTQGADGYVAFFIAPGVIAGDNDLFFDRESHDLYLTGGGKFGIGTIPALDIDVSKEAEGIDVAIIARNTAAVASSDARISTQVDPSGGDAFMSFNVQGTTTWTVGIDNDDSDKLKIGTNFAVGTDTHLTIDTTGKTGIGTGSPSGRLHVVDTSFPPIRTERDTGASTTGMFGALAVTAITSGNMADGFGSSLIFRIEDDAATQNSLARIGAQRQGADNTGRLYFATYNVGTPTNHMVLDEDGNFGIGTESPTVRLDVNGDMRVAGAILNDDLSETIQVITQALDGYGSGNVNQALGFTGADGYVAFFTGNEAIAGDNDLFYNRGSGDLTLGGGGKLAIGQSSPSALLDVLGDVDDTATVTLKVVNQNAGTGARGSVRVQSDNQTLLSAAYSDAFNALTRAGETLGGATEIIATGSGHTKFLIGNISSTPLHLFTSDTVALTVDASQQVGIGTKTPVSELEVANEGASNFTGVYVSSYATAAPSGRAAVVFRSATGTEASPGDTTTDDTIGELIAQGYAGGDFRSAASIDFLIAPTGTISASSIPSNIAFFTTPDGSISRQERMRIDEDGNISIVKDLVVGGDLVNQTLSETIQVITQAMDGYGGGSGNVSQADGFTGADGYIAFFTGNEAIAGDNDLFWERDTNRLRMGTIQSSVGFTMSGDSQQPGVALYAAGNTGVFTGYRSGGTISSLSATPATSFLGFFGGGGHDGTDWTGVKAAVIAIAGESFTSSNQGTYLSLQTTPLTSTTRTERLRVNTEGEIWVSELSSGGTPDSGFGAIYAKIDGRLYFKDDGGTEYDLTSTGTGDVSQTSGFTGADGYIAFWTGQGEIAGDNDLFWDRPNNRLGIGTSAPEATFHLVSTDDLQFDKNFEGTSGPLINARKSRGQPGSLSSALSGDNLSGFNMSAYDGTSYVLAAQMFGRITGTVSAGIIPTSLIFRTTDVSGSLNEVVRITNDEKVGIGTDTPDQTLHVHKDSAGSVTVSNNTIAVFENSTSGYITVLTPDANERGILFGEVSDTAAGGIIYNAGGTADGLQFRVNGNSTQMVIDSSGQVGIGTTSPSVRLDVVGDMHVAGAILNDDLSETFQVILQALDGYSGGGGGLSETTFQENKNFWNEAIYHLTVAADGYGSGGGDVLKTTGFDGADGYIAFWTGTSAIAGDNDLFFDREGHNLILTGDGKLGLGINNPNERLTIDGAISIQESNAPDALDGYGKLYVLADGYLHYKREDDTEFKLDVLDADSPPVDGYVLTSDETGKGTWQDPAQVLDRLIVNDDGTLILDAAGNATYTFIG